jgi:membrane AbrB-like protein
LLSARGQRKAREASFFFSFDTLLPEGADGPTMLPSSALLRPIEVGLKDQYNTQRGVLVLTIRLALQWALAIGFSFALAVTLALYSVPAAFLVGPMITGIVFALHGATIRLPRSAFIAGQAVIGCSIAQAITLSVVAVITQSWIVMITAVLATVAASALVGWLLVRFGTLPGTTAAWGTSPGAASAMVAMAQDFGADPVAVAMMQYLRVVLVVLTASLVSRLWLAPEHLAHGTPVAASLGPSNVNILHLIATIMVVAVGAWLGVHLRMPAGALLVPMIAAALLQGAGLLTVTLPRAVLLVGYGVIGLSIGLRFSRDLLRDTVRVLPEMLASALILVALCAALAWVLVKLLHIDVLTAYLATTPGGIDSVAIIALDSHADAPFVMALQTLRLLVVILTAPSIAKLLSKNAGRR